MWFLDCQPNLIDRRNESLPSVESVFGFVFVSCVADEGTEVAHTDTDTWGLADVDIMISYFSYKMRMYQEEKTNSIIYIKIE